MPNNATGSSRSELETRVHMTNLDRHEDDRRILTVFPEAKMIHAKRDTVIGGHYHQNKTEYFILARGACVLRQWSSEKSSRDADEFRMEIGQLFEVTPGQVHEFHIGAGSILIGLNSRPYDPSDDYKQ